MDLKRRRHETDFKYNGDRRDFFKFERELTTQLELANSQYLLNPIRINQMRTIPVRPVYITRQVIPDADQRKHQNDQEQQDYNWKLQNYRKETKKIDEDATHAKAIMKSLLADNILIQMNHITTPRMVNDNEYQNFMILYEHIQTTYLPRDPRFIDEVRRDIQLLNDINGIKQLISELDILQDILIRSSPLDALRDTAMKATFLNSIKSYNHDTQFQQLITMCRETDTITYNNTCTRLKNYMESNPTLTHQTTTPPTFNAYIANQQKDTNNTDVPTYYSNEIRTCYNCKLNGHTAKDCKSKKCGLCQKLFNNIQERVQHYYEMHNKQSGQYNNNKRKTFNNNGNNHQANRQKTNNNRTPAYAATTEENEYQEDDDDDNDHPTYVTQHTNNHEPNSDYQHPDCTHYQE